MSDRIVTEAMEDAGFENVDVWYQKKKPRGYHYKADGKSGFLGANFRVALANIAKMPSPNKVEKTQVVKVEDGHIELDDFGNPVTCNFGSR